MLSNSPEKQKNVMVTKLLSLIDARLLGWTLPPIGGLSAIFTLAEFTEGKWYYAIFGVVAFVITAILANYVKLRIKDRELDVTETSNNNNVNLSLMELMQKENARRDANFAEQLQREKEFFSKELAAEKLFWTGRFDTVLKEERSRCENEKIYWAEREQKIRDEKHALANEFNPKIIRYEGVLLQLRARGIDITAEGQLLWPDKLRKSREDDPAVSSGEFTMKVGQNENE